MKKWLALLTLPLVFLLTGCEDSNGWDAIPIDDTEDACYQITRWEYDGWDSTKYWAEGIYCPQDTEEG